MKAEPILFQVRSYGDNKLQYEYLSSMTAIDRIFFLMELREVALMQMRDFAGTIRDQMPAEVTAALHDEFAPSYKAFPV